MAKKNELPYPVHMTEDVFAEDNTVLADTLREITGVETPKVALVADMNVVQRTQNLGLKVGRYFQTHSIALAASPTVISAGERIKADNFQSAMTVASALIDARVGINDVVIALGGGTLLDVAGYAAAQARGGIKTVRIPTTAAAMIDGAFAEYAALDGANVKDAFRVASVPSAVVIDPLFTKTVLDGVWRGGFSEAVRFAAVTDSALMKKIASRADAVRTRDYEALKTTIEECTALRRKGKSAGNFSTWCALRLEAMSGYKLPHGYAMAIAICIDCAYAVEKKYMKPADQHLICTVLAECGALDGLNHSKHLLSQGESVVLGIESLVLSQGKRDILLPAGAGKSAVEENPDKDVLLKVIKEFHQASQGG